MRSILKSLGAWLVSGRYNYKHSAIVGAVGESSEGGMSFSFWEDKVCSAASLFIARGPEFRVHQCWTC